MTYLVEQAITQVTDDELLIPGASGPRSPTFATASHAPRKHVRTSAPSGSPPRRRPSSLRS